jgi:thioredoxin-dependent peroxiredoxin
MPTIGEKAPDFELESDAGEVVKLSDFRGKKVILYFYPKAGTSGCTTQARAFRDETTELAHANAVVIGVSPDPIKALQKFREAESLNFSLLSDLDHKVAEEYGVWGEKKMYGKSYMGIVRSHFVIDETGLVVDAQVNVKAEESCKIALRKVAEM